MKKKLGLLCISLIVSVTVLEIYLRLFNPFHFRNLGERIVLPKNQTIIYTNDIGDKIDQQIVHQRNSLGFRGPEPPTDFHQATTLLAVGGSTTETIALSEEDTWTMALHHKLQANFNDIWLNNAGIDGHSTFGHRLLLDQYIQFIQPDYILYLVGINEMGLSQKSRYDLIFTQDTQTIAAKLPVQTWLRQLSLVQNINNLLVWNQTRQSIFQSHSQVSFLQDGLNDTQTDFRILGTSDLEVDRNKILAYHQEYLDMYKDRLTSLIKATQQYSIEPILITQPIVYGDVIDPTTNINLGKLSVENSGLNTIFNIQEIPYIYSRDLEYILELYNQVTRDVAQTEKVFLIDLAKKMPKDTAYYYDSVHYTKQGAVVVADIIYQDLCLFLSEVSTATVKSPCQNN